MSLDPIRCTSDDNRSWQAEPLSSDRYAECVEIYEAASNQRRLLQQSLTNQIGDAYAGRALRMLNVGSGSGEFDAGVLEHLAPRLGPIDYTGIDPNPHQCELARQRLAPLAGAALRVDVVNDVFAPSLLHGRYDVICFVHCLYYFDDPGMAIGIALHALAPGGRLIVVHAPNEALNALAARFWADARGRDSWFSADVRAALADRSLVFAAERIDARLNASGCPGCGRAEDGAIMAIGSAVADFIAQVDITRLPAAIQAQTYAYLGEIVQSERGRRYFAHPVDVLTVVNDALLPRGDQKPRRQRLDARPA